MSNIGKISISDIEKLQESIKEKVKTISEWKRLVKEFAIEHELTDMEAIDIANGRINKYLNKE